MQDFSYERLRTQEAALEPYILYRKDQAVQAERNVRIRDFEYFKSMYPDRVKALQLVVEEVCDEMEYEGSPIYDEYPDRILMEQMIQKIAQRAEVTDEKPEQAEMTTEEVEPEEIQETLPRVSYGPVRNEYGGGEGYRTWEMDETTQIQEAGPRRPWGPPSPPNPWGPPPPPNPWGPPPPPNPWGPPPPPPRPWGPPPPPPTPCCPPPRPWGPPPRPRNNFMNDILGILLFNELQGRRCRSGRCR